MDYDLKAERLTKIYGRHKALDNFSLHIPKGAIYGLVGKNGAGKTTLLRLICGLQEVTSGDYALYGISSRKHEIFASQSMVKAQMAAGGFEIQSYGVVIHPDGTANYYVCGDISPEKKAKIEAQMKAEDEEKAKRKQQYREQSEKAAEKRRMETELAYRRLNLGPQDLWK